MALLRLPAVYLRGGGGFVLTKVISTGSPRAALFADLLLFGPRVHQRDRECVLLTAGALLKCRSPAPRAVTRCSPPSGNAPSVANWPDSNIEIRKFLRPRTSLRRGHASTECRFGPTRGLDYAHVHVHAPRAHAHARPPLEGHSALLPCAARTQ